MSKSIGELIAEIIETNIKIWHEDTHLRNNTNLTSREKSGYGMRGRSLNNVRSELKYAINKFFDDHDYDDRKINYSGGPC